MTATSFIDINDTPLCPSPQCPLLCLGILGMSRGSLSCVSEASPPSIWLLWGGHSWAELLPPPLRPGDRSHPLPGAASPRVWGRPFSHSPSGQQKSTFVRRESNLGEGRRDRDWGSAQRESAPGTGSLLCSRKPAIPGSSRPQGAARGLGVPLPG